MLGEMKDENSDSPIICIIHDAESAALLISPQGQRFLSPFLSRECTISEAARELGVPVNSLLYRVKRMVELELLKVVRKEKRPGRAVKIYCSKANIFYVPYEFTSAETFEGLLLPMNQHWQKLFLRSALKAFTDISPGFGLQISRWKTGEPYVKVA
jgi:hypothetical protein